jgi:UDP-N-acetylmuramoyl-tripeptide--D-alanyl-D-alanine ligase
MIPVDLAALVTLLDARLVLPDAVGADAAADGPLAAVMTDSRVPSTTPAVFFALRTATGDGHDHVLAASRAGAAVAVVDRVAPGVMVPQVVVADVWAALGRLARHTVDASGCRVVAITGSYGKTTVKDLCAAALSAGRRVAASQASFNNELGVPLTMLSVEQGTDVLVAEAGARNAGDLAVLGRLLRPDVSVITAVGPVHLETFGDEEGVAAEKSQLVAALRTTGTAVLNSDDPRVAAMARLAPATLMISTTAAGSDLTAERVMTDVDGRVRAVVRTPWGSTDLALPVPGTHHLMNAMLALAVAGLEGIDPVAAAEAIAAAPTSASRSALQRVGGVTILDDAYNASPPTMSGALRTLASLPCGGRRWAVLGVMAELGEGSLAQHEAVGRACVGVVDELVVVGDAAAGIAEGARGAAAGAGAPVRIRTVTDQAEAARLVIGEVTTGDVVLFKASRVATLDRAAASVIAALAGADAA